MVELLSKAAHVEGNAQGSYLTVSRMQQGLVSEIAVFKGSLPSARLLQFRSLDGLKFGERD